MERIIKFIWLALTATALWGVEQICGSIFSEWARKKLQGHGFDEGGIMIWVTTNLIPLMVLLMSIIGIFCLGRITTPKINANNKKTTKASIKKDRDIKTYAFHGFHRWAYIGIGLFVDPQKNISSRTDHSNDDTTFNFAEPLVGDYKVEVRQKEEGNSLKWSVVKKTRDSCRIRFGNRPEGVSGAWIHFIGDV